MARPKPVASLIVSPFRSTTPTIVGGVLFGGIFILLIVGCLYYANLCRASANPSSLNLDHRGDFFRRFRDLRSTFVDGPVASTLPLHVRTDNILRSLNFTSPPADLNSRNARAHLTVPPPYGHAYEHPPSYEASVSDHGSTTHSPIWPPTPGSAAGERWTASRSF
ncbi:hypothetical protein LXA43DRAFT_609125 [Ganoderma leucocontextum]|nr:hypothetical protein LXA43DRAFT_609125 [Ganoderma leucocontextum]